MSRNSAILLFASALILAPAVLAAQAVPPAQFVAKKEKPAHGNGGHDKGEKHGQTPDDNEGAGHHDGGDHGEDGRDWRFKSGDRDAVLEFYRSEYGAGRCPPGLAKKNNGCLPPGQAKKVWVRGEYLPADYTFYDLPGALYDVLSRRPMAIDMWRSMATWC